MIFLWILQFFVNVLNVLTSWLPTVTALPFGMDAALLGAVGDWNQFLSDFWPLVIVWECVLWYLGIKVLLLVLKLFFGHRIR